jgi:hypothetical protein
MLRRLLGLPERSPEEERLQYAYVIGISAIAIIYGMFRLFPAWHEYRALDNTPVNLTIEQAMPSPDATETKPRWVKLTGLTETPCSQVIRDDGTLKYFASDSSNQRWVLVTARPGDSSCGPLVFPTSGILKGADAGTRRELKSQQMQIPPSEYPLMEFAAGTDPSTMELYGDYGLYLITVGVVGLAVSFFKLFPFKKASAVARPVSMDVRPNGNRSATDAQKHRL